MSILKPYNQLSEEQKGVIRRVSRESDNLFVEGPPGSGKTLISLYALRDIVQESNVKPLLMMYNQSLYGYLSSALNALGIRDNLTIVTKDKFFWDMARIRDIYPPDPKASYGEKYDYLLKKLADATLSKEHDITVVDEVQDLVPEEWELIKKISHKVLTLGDFDQGIYGTSLNNESLINYGRFEKLTKVFRFHKNIAKLAKLFSRKNDDLVGKVHNDSQTQPTLIDVSSSEELSKIVEVVNQIKSYKERIGIISPDISSLKQLSKHFETNQVEHKFYTENRDLRSHDFTSKTPLLITSFSAKGLEFEHVILFGFDENSNSVYNLRRKGQLQSIIYVSITRTNSNLYIIRTENCIPELQNIKIEEEITGPIIDIDDIF